MEQKINDLLTEAVNPQLAKHRGACTLSKVEANIAYIKLEGGCKGCAGRQQTLLNGIKPFLQNNVEGLEDVRLVD